MIIPFTAARQMVDEWQWRVDELAAQLYVHIRKIKLGHIRLHYGFSACQYLVKEMAQVEWNPGGKQTTITFTPREYDFAIDPKFPCKYRIWVNESGNLKLTKI